MNYRLAKIEDVEQIDSLCKRENIASPFDGTTIVAEDYDKIVGFINFSQIAFVNGFVSDNSLSSNVLYEKMATVLEMLGTKRVMIFPKNEEIEKLADRKGFKVTNKSVNTMEKLL